MTDTLTEDPQAGPATITPTPGVTTWVMGKAFALYFPGGNWNVLLRPTNAEQTTWALYAVPRPGTEGCHRYPDGHLPIATGTDPADLAVFGRRWATLASDMAHRVGAAIYVGLSSPVSRCAIHPGCDTAPRCDKHGIARRCDILSHPHCDTAPSDSDTCDSDSPAARDSDSDRQARP